jgi:carboxypeptidase Taq
MQKIQELKTRLADVVHLQQTAALLGWDQQVKMPPGGAEARAEQLALISRLAHEMFVADEVGQLIDDAAAEANGLDYGSQQGRKHDYDKPSRH